MDTNREELIRLQERVANQAQAIGRAHDRVDGLSKRMDEGFIRVEGKLDILAREMAPLNGWMNKGKGAVTALVFVSGGIGAAFMYLFNAMTGRP